jgi:hypothetical protein
VEEVSEHFTRCNELRMEAEGKLEKFMVIGIEFQSNAVLDEK